MAQSEPRDLASNDPFVVLAVAPTMDFATVKRAYFTAIASHPPHRDPDAFRAIRAAYDALSTPSALAAAFLRSAVDRRAALAPYEARFGRALEEESAKAKRARLMRARVDDFVRETSRASFVRARALVER